MSKSIQVYEIDRVTPKKRRWWKPWTWPRYHYPHKDATHIVFGTESCREASEKFLEHLHHRSILNAVWCISLAPGSRDHWLVTLNPKRHPLMRLTDEDCANPESWVVCTRIAEDAQ